MQVWKRALAGSLGVLGLAMFVQAQTGNDRPGVEARSVPAASQHPTRPRQPDTLTTTGLSYYNIDPSELVPYSDYVHFVRNIYGGSLYSTNFADEGFSAPLHLPSGAMLVTIELDYYDNSPTGEAMATLVVSDYDGLSVIQPYSSDCTAEFVTACSGVPDTDTWSYRIFDLTAFGITVDNYYNKYSINAGTTTTDGSTGIIRISIGYKLQVSPGPATATFSDVPTNHPFFKFVEALHAAGITNGYPDGRFGVNDFITRGQMAVFLSSALGLNWP